LRLIAVEIEEDFREEAMVERLVFLKLHLDEEDRFRGGMIRREKYTINAKARFFDLYRLKAIALNLLNWNVNENKEQGWKALKDLVEDGIASHAGVLNK
jgi:hypothetical protein